MAKNETSPATLPLIDRLGFRLTASFLIVFGGTFFIGLAADVVDFLARDAGADSTQATRPAPAADQNIEDQLAKVIETDLTPEKTEVRDPFTDRGGLSGRTADTLSSSTTAAVTPGKTDAGPGATSSGGTGVTSQQEAPGRSEVAPKKEIDPASTEATLSRIRARNEAISRGLAVGPESEVFTINDLTPVGVVSGGNSGQDVIFYSEALERTVSFPVGSRFFDGWLAGVGPDGVEFRGLNSNETRFKSWLRGE